MSEEQQSPAEAREAAAIRRRWITLGEVLAVLAVLISGLTFWNSYTERSTAEAERAAEKRQSAAKAETLVLRAEAGRNGARLRLTALDARQAIQSQTLTFPSALGLRRIDTLADPRIETRWFDDELKRARKAAGAEKIRVGDARLPIAILTRFVVDGDSHTDSAIYDIGYRVDDGLLGSRIELRGLSLVEQVPGGAAQARLDALWRARQPTSSSSPKK